MRLRDEILEVKISRKMTENEWQKYKKKHPGADPKKHEIVKEPGAKKQEFEEEVPTLQRKKKPTKEEKAKRKEELKKPKEKKPKEKPPEMSEEEAKSHYKDNQYKKVDDLTLRDIATAMTWLGDPGHDQLEDTAKEIKKQLTEHGRKHLKNQGEEDVDDEKALSTALDLLHTHIDADDEHKQSVAQKYPKKASLRARIVRLAKEHPELRKDLVSLLKQATRGRYDITVSVMQGLRSGWIYHAVVGKKTSPITKENFKSLLDRPDYLGYIQQLSNGKALPHYYSAVEDRYYGLKAARDIKAAADATRKKHKEVQEILGDAEKHLERELKAHDWYYAYSDDYRAHSAGQAHSDLIKELLTQVSKKKAEALWKKYAPKDIRFPKVGRSEFHPLDAQLMQVRSALHEMGQELAHLPGADRDKKKKRLKALIERHIDNVNREMFTLMRIARLRRSSN